MIQRASLRAPRCNDFVFILMLSYYFIIEKDDKFPNIVVELIFILYGFQV